jgi:hypothetical protein
LEPIPRIANRDLIFLYIGEVDAVCIEIRLNLLSISKQTLMVFGYKPAKFCGQIACSTETWIAGIARMRSDGFENQSLTTFPLVNFHPSVNA